MITFPTWYEGGYPDRHLVVMDILQPILNQCLVLDRAGDQIFDGPDPRLPFACSWLPKDYGDHLPIVRVYRGGGAITSDGLIDPASVQIGVIAETQADSAALAEFCAQWLLSFQHGGKVTHEDHSVSYVRSITEMVGPQLIPELNPDFRLVTRTFNVECRKPTGLPDYAVIRESLAL